MSAVWISMGDFNGHYLFIIYLFVAIFKQAGQAHGNLLLLL